MINALSTLPKELIQSRKEIEARFVFSLWKEPETFADYENEIDYENDMITGDGKFFYSLGLKMYKAEFTVFDDIAIDSFLSPHEEMYKTFNEKGGFTIVAEARSIINAENNEKYYDDLLKSNAMINLHKIGYDIETRYERLNEMTYEQMEDYMEYVLNEVFLKSSSTGVNTADMTTGYKAWIEQWNMGMDTGYPIAFNSMNYNLAGIHRKNLILHLGHIGQGKTSTSIFMYLLPTIESGEKVCVIANEQDENQWRQMLLSTIVFNKIGYNKLNRQKFLFGGFSAEDLVAMAKAEEWLKEYEGNFELVHLTDYSVSTVKRIMKKYAKRGFGLFLFDTLKPVDESSPRAWAEFSEMAKALFLVAQKEDVAVIATAQLSSSSNGRKYLDLSCIGKSQAIAETAGQVIMFRPMKHEEKEKMEVYQWKSVGDNGKSIKVKKELNVEKDYVIFFIAKNRYGAGDIQIVCERNMAFNYYKEIGYCHMEYDGFK